LKNVSDKMIELNVQKVRDFLRFISEEKTSSSYINYLKIATK